MIIFMNFSGCASYPKTSVVTLDTRPKLVFQNTPSGSILYVDGLNMGDPAVYNGKPKVLFVEPGTHEVVIASQNGEEIHRQTVFVESEIKTINVGH